MKILRTYILNEFLTAFILSIFILTFVMILGNMIKVTELIITKGVPLAISAKLFMYLIPYLFTFILPIATLSATMLSLGRLSSDNELIAMRTSGLSLMRILTPVFIVSIALSLFCVLLNNNIIPEAHHKSRETLIQLGTKNPTAALEAGTFITTFEKFIIFIYQIDGNKFSNIRIYEPQGPEKPPRTIIAKHGEFIVLPEKNLLKLKLIEGISDEINPRDPENFYKLKFKQYFMNIDFKKMETRKVDKKAKDMTLVELREQLAKFQSENIETTPIHLEINKRAALSFACIIFAVMGAPLAIVTNRREKSINLALAFVVVALYYLIFIGCEALGAHGTSVRPFRA